MRRTATVRGRVVDANDRPVIGALIQEAANVDDLRLIVDQAYEMSHPVRTDQQDRFLMPSRAPLPRFRLHVTHPEFIEAEFGPYALSPANVTETGDLVLQQGAEMTIEVLGPQGPVEGVEILLTPLGPKNVRKRPVHITTHADGRGVTRALGEARVDYRVLRIPDGYTLGDTPPHPTSLSLDGSDRLVFRVVRPHFLTGTVVGPEGKPIPKADFLAHRIDEGAGPAVRRRFHADALGAFREGVPEGSIWEIEFVVKWAVDDFGNYSEVRHAVKSGSPLEPDVPATVVTGERLDDGK